MPLMTIGQTAGRLSLHERTVRRLIGDGSLVAVRVGRSVRIDERDLEEFIDQSRGPAHARAPKPPSQKRSHSRTSTGPAFSQRLRSEHDTD